MAEDDDSSPDDAERRLKAVRAILVDLVVDAMRNEFGLPDSHLPRKPMPGTPPEGRKARSRGSGPGRDAG